ncbi:hypothetical protein ACKKBG_A31910 [Auxenochlorella protothecoides x Auxenochlorella symbiontica]
MMSVFATPMALSDARRGVPECAPLGSCRPERTSCRHMPAHRVQSWKPQRRGSVMKSKAKDSLESLRDQAARDYELGRQAGRDADDLVAEQLGLSSSRELSGVQERYKDRIKESLEKRAKELQSQQAQRERGMKLGKIAYGRGRYSAAVTLFEAALEEEGPFSHLGGDIQMWLALSYQACGREAECIDVYKRLEESHPLPSTRRRAADLRYIMEAPKLPLSDKDRVHIPVLKNMDVNRGVRAPTNRPRAPPTTASKREKTWDERFWETYEPPQYLTNKYVWFASSLLAVAVSIYGNMARHGLGRLSL